MKKLIIWSGNHPGVLLPLILALTAVAVLGILRIRIDSSPTGMMIEGDPAIDVYEETLDTFGTDNITIVQAGDPELFTPEKLLKLEELVYELEDLHGVSRVESLFSVTNFKGVDGFLETNPLIDYVPESIDETEAIRADALRNPVLLDDIISKDGHTTAINLFVEPDPEVKDFNTVFSRSVDEVLEKYAGEFGTLNQLGMSYTQRQVVDNIRADQFTLGPLSAFVLLLTLVVAMRSKCGAILPMLTAGVSVLWTVGFMGFIGIPLNILTVIVPSLIIVIGSTEDIHMLSEYIEGTHEKSTRALAVEYMANKVGVAVLLTSITTFLGFFSITFNQITILRQFGIAAAFGLFVNPLLTCMIAPMYLKHFGAAPKASDPKHGDEPEQTGTVDRMMAALANGLLKLIHDHRNAALTVLLVGMCGVGLFAINVRVDNDMLGYFKADSDIRVRSQQLHDTLSGAQCFFIPITSDHEGAFLEPERLKKIQAIQQFLTMSGFDNSISLADQISLIHREMNGGEEGMYHVPDDENLIAQYMLFLHDDDVSRYVNHDRSRANILVRHNLSSSYELQEALHRLQDYMDNELGLAGTYTFTGENILINAAADSMAAGQAKSLIFLLAIVFILMTVLFVNVRAGLLSLVPNIFPIVLNFGMMGILGIPLNPGTAMVAAIAIGIAVDDTIHLMSRYNEEMRALQDREQAISVCIRSEVKPVFSTTVALALGFAVLATSSFAPVVHYGLLSALAMCFALLADMLITPMLLSKIQLVTLWDMVGLKLREEVIRSSPLFQGLRRWQIKKVVLMGRIDDCPAGERIFSEGDQGSSMYLILEGRGQVLHRDPENGHRLVYAEIGPGEVVGEIALIEHGPRSADVEATEDMKYIEIDWPALNRVQVMYPWVSSKLFMNLSRIMGRRLIHANEMIRHAG